MEYPVLLEGEQVGTAAVVEEGERLAVSLDCREDNRGLFRGYLICPEGEIPLGVLEPRGRRLWLQRRLLREEIRPLGRPQGIRLRMSFAFGGEWQDLREPSWFSQAAGEDLSETKGLLWRQEGSRRFLALPYDPGRPFPLVRLFCLARIQTVGSRRYAVYGFDSSGRPLLPGGGRGATDPGPSAGTPG